ncbi:MAG: DUF3276 family protein, partial [Bacteroidales bacterium]|nr:DUF3276 family protein [Bacteroidales bacterium]
FTFDKHKIFLYKEDFEKFADGLKDAVEFIRTKLGSLPQQEAPASEEDSF